MDKLIDAFEETYSRKYTHAAKYPEAGYHIMELGLHASAPKPKPELRRYPLSGKDPPTGAFNGEREIYKRGEWKIGAVYEMDLLESGNEIEGLAILEAPSTTMLVPVGKKVTIDEHRRYWLREA